MHSKHCLTPVTLPDGVTIFGTKINVHGNEVSHRELSNLTERRISLETLILRTTLGKQAFNVDFKLLYSLYLSTKYKSKVIVFSSDIWRQSGHSPAMKQTKHIRGVNNLVEEINNVESKQECQTMK